MFRNTLTVAMLAVVTLAATFVAPQEAHANSRTRSAYNAAMRAQRFAQTKTEQAGRVQASYTGQLSSFNAGAASSSQITRSAARRTFIMYLQKLQRALREAISAHDNAVRHWFAYNRASGTTNANGTIAALQAAIARFQATINQAQAHINMAGNLR